MFGAFDFERFKNWQVQEPLISGMRDVPECPDYFNGTVGIIWFMDREEIHIM